MGIGYPYTRGFGRVVRFSSADSRRSAPPRETEVHTDRNFKDDSLLSGQALRAPPPRWPLTPTVSKLEII